MLNSPLIESFGRIFPDATRDEMPIRVRKMKDQFLPGQAIALTPTMTAIAQDWLCHNEKFHSNTIDWKIDKFLE